MPTVHLRRARPVRPQRAAGRRHPRAPCAPPATTRRSSRAAASRTFEQAEAILARGEADFVAAARQSLADPDWFRKIRLGHGDDRAPLRVHQLLRGARPAAQAGHLQALGPASELDEPGVRLAADGKRRLDAPAWPPPAPEAPRPPPRSARRAGRVAPAGRRGAWPDVAALARRPPPTTAFIERWKSVQRAAGRSDRVDRAWVPYAAISPSLKVAVLVAEDINFFSHDGFDRGEIRKALTQALEDLELPRGASTITQQLAKNLWLSPSRDPLRKTREAILTWQLERTLGKRRILELYLNLVEFGPASGARRAPPAATSAGGRRTSATTRRPAWPRRCRARPRGIRARRAPRPDATPRPSADGWTRPSSCAACSDPPLPAIEAPGSNSSPVPEGWHTIGARGLARGRASGGRHAGSLLGHARVHSQAGPGNRPLRRQHLLRRGPRRRAR